MTNKPLISIILPTYNAEKYIKETIESILNQTYKNWELIITDDNSSDKTLKILRLYAKRFDRIKLYINSKNEGAACARNNCLKFCNSDFIAFIDSDDWWEINKLELQINFMLENNYPISFTSYRLIDENGVSINKIIESKKIINYNNYLKNTIIGMSTSMINKKITGPFDFVDIRTRQDTYLWISLLKRGLSAHGINQVLCNYRVRKNSLSSNKIKAALMVWSLYRDFEKFNFFKSLYFFLFYLYNAFKKRFL